MNKIYSTFNKAGVFTSPPGFFLSLIFSVKSDTNRDSGFLFTCISFLIHSLLDHMVGADTRASFNLPHPILQNCNKNSIDNNIIITSKVLLLTRQWGGISA